MRASYKGSTSGFQPENGGSSPPARSRLIDFLNFFYIYRV